MAAAVTVGALWYLLENDEEMEAEEEKECSTFLNDTFNCFSGPVS